METNATIIGIKQGEFIADRNNITRVWMDHGAWPFLTTKLYIEQRGDIEFLLEKQSYFKDIHRKEEQKRYSFMGLTKEIKFLLEILKDIKELF